MRLGFGQSIALVEIVLLWGRLFLRVATVLLLRRISLYWIARILRLRHWVARTLRREPLLRHLHWVRLLRRVAMLLIGIVDRRCFLSSVALLRWIIHLLLLPLTLVRVVHRLSVLIRNWLVHDDCLVSGLLSWRVVASAAFFAQIAASKAHQKLTKAISCIWDNFLLMQHFPGDSDAYLRRNTSWKIESVVGVM